MRPPSVFVRELSPHEGERLRRMSKRAKHFSTRQRAAILLASNTRMSAPEIARMWQTDESHVRKVIHDFNERGFGSLRPDYRGGRPRRITAEQRRSIVAVAGARPDSQGIVLTRCSLPRLADHLVEQGFSVSMPSLYGTPGSPARTPRRPATRPTTPGPRSSRSCASASPELRRSRAGT